MKTILVAQHRKASRRLYSPEVFRYISVWEAEAGEGHPDNCRGVLYEWAKCSTI